MRLGYCVCAAAANASHPERNRDTARATGVMPLRILAPWRNQYAMLHVDFARPRSEEHTSELQSRELISYGVLCEKKKKKEPSIAWNTRPRSQQKKAQRGCVL